MADARIAAFNANVDKVLAHLHNEFSKLQTGRANGAFVEHVMVDAYGQKQELRTIAGISVPDAKTIVIQAWDRSILGSIEKALQQADIGANPVNDGVVIRINLPPMTEERRSQMTKVVGKLSEDARISIRQARQEAHDGIKQEKDEDVKETLIAELQKAVDAANAQIAEVAKKKEEELMTI